MPPSSLVAACWSIEPDLARRLCLMGEVFHQNTGHDLRIISGHRTCDEQKDLARQGRPAAPCELSTHTIYPAQGADLRIIGSFPAASLKQSFGAAAVTAGLRWGGGSEVDERGIPSDWNHVDLGRRTDPVAQAYRRSHREGSPGVA